MMKVLLRIAGLCGILGPVLAFVFISVSVVLHPWFSWWENALSDLGALGVSFNFVYNVGLVVTGVVFLLFVAGLPVLLKGLVGRVGVGVLVLSAFSLMAIGVFPSGTSPHGGVTLAFFLVRLVCCWLVLIFYLSMIVVVGVF